MSTGLTPFPKIARLSRDIVVTEKLDGTNAAVRVIDSNDISAAAFVNVPDSDPLAQVGDHLFLFAQSRTRLITTSDDNFGFAAWVVANAQELATLGPGCHFGEWWGRGIQRNYELSERRFSLFNTARWAEQRPACCDVVPTLYAGPFATDVINGALFTLAGAGSVAAPGFAKPEGIVIWHEAARQLFKKTIEGDEVPKGRA